MDAPDRNTGARDARSRLRNLAGVLLPAIVILLVVGLLADQFHRAGRRSLVREGYDRLTYRAVFVRDLIDRNLARVVENLESWGRQPMMLRILDDDPDNEIGEFLARAAEASGDTVEIWCRAADGRVVAASDAERFTMAEPLAGFSITEVADNPRAKVEVGPEAWEITVPVVREFDRPEVVGVLTHRLRPTFLLPDESAAWVGVTDRFDQPLVARGVGGAGRTPLSTPDAWAPGVAPWVRTAIPLRMPARLESPELKASVALSYDEVFGRITSLSVMVEGLAAGTTAVLLAAYYMLASRQRRLDATLRATELERLNADLAASQVELREAKERAEEATAAKSRFLANMSHEIRTPLNAVIGMTGLLLDSELDADQRETAEMARDAGVDLLAMVNGILDFSKSEAGHTQLEPVDTDLDALVERTLGLLAPTAQGKGLELSLRVGADVPSRVSCDPVRLRQVLLNLLGNAIKFTERGGVELELERQEDRDGLAQVRFVVRDTGIGIPEDRRQRLFQAFTQGDVSTTRRFGGTGLGLAISRQLVELMGGRIELVSREGEGSTFSFTVALRETSPRLVPILPRPLVVVVLGREGGARDGVVGLARGWGWQCRRVATLREAEEVAKEAPIDLAVIDLNVPGPDVEGLRKRLGGARIVSLGTAEEHRSRRGVAHPDGTLTQPVGRRQLAALADDLFARRPGEARTPEPESGLPAVGLPAGTRILLAEDSETSVEYVQRAFGRHGVGCEVVSSGAEALLAVEQIHFDLVLMDLMMPEMDGLEAVRRIRKRERESGRRLPILALTADVAGTDRQACLEAGFDDLLTKPIAPEELVRVVARWIPGASPGSDGEARPVPGLSRSERRAQEEAQWNGVEVLLVDDNAVNRKLLRRVLERYGCGCLAARNGLEAVQAIKEMRFSLILMDVMMPEVDGIHATREIRKIEAQRGGRTPIIGISACAQPEDRSLGLEAGMDEYLEKPLDVVSLREILERWFPRGAGGGQASIRRAEGV